MKKIHLFGVLLVLITMQYSIAQTSDTKNWLEIGTGITDGKYQPFWLRSNQYGMVPVRGSYFQTNAGYVQDYKKKGRLKFGYGANVQFLVGTDKSAVQIPELYVKSKLGIFEFWAGMRKQTFGLADSTISSGSFVWSGNALPIPKIELTVPNWFYPKKGGFFAFKGNFAHGVFENNRTDAAHVFLHQKSFYGQFGRETSTIKLFAGFNHQVQWGGKLLYADPNNVSGIGGQVPTSFLDYIYVVTGFNLAATNDTTARGKNDAGNRVGNHLGSVDIGAEIDFGSFKVLGYRQSYYEDGSLFWLNNITDGLHGISIQSKKEGTFRKLVLEYFNSTSQGGPIGSDAPFAWQRGLDNYFNNGVYPQGWSYRSRGMGSPFITSINETDLPNTNNSYFDNNRVEAFYIASEWEIKDTKILFKGSLANAIGWYGKEFVPVKKMYSLALFAQKPMKILGYEATVKANIGYDQSEWYKNTLGGNIGISVPLF